MKKKMLIIIGSILGAWLLIATVLLIIMPKGEDFKYKDLQVKKLKNIKISGAVNFPGTYKIREGLTVKELINFANGTKEGANLKDLDLDREIEKDEKEIKIPFKEVKVSSKININKASYEEMKKAKIMNENRIIAILFHRQNKGSFKSIDEFKKLNAISEKDFSKIKERLEI